MLDAMSAIDTLQRRLDDIDSRLRIAELAMEELMLGLQKLPKSELQLKMSLLIGFAQRADELSREVEFLLARDRQQLAKEAELRLEAVRRIQQHISTHRELSHIAHSKITQIFDAHKKDPPQS